jgi:hypothetical protein
MKKLIGYKAILMAALLWGGLSPAQAFVLIGPANTSTNANETAQLNYTDDMGTPKDINRGTKRFFRWNIPDFVYSFDASFVNYFGLEGMDAVHEAFGVMNDFFENEDYSGVSQMDLARHGFSSNYNTTWINTTAQNAQIIDIKSLMLGMLVNQVGMGNPHRWAFTITGMRTNATTNSLIFETRLRNYDPITWRESDIINNVKYSYRLVHDATNITVGAIPGFGVADMEEFTTDTSGNAWTAAAAIPDAFYGNTALYWTDTPSLFNFGVYYDGLNAMGGQFRARHALTYDDAGGLKYLYATNNYIYEDLPGSVMLVEPAQFLPSHIATHFPSPSGRLFPFFPRQGVNPLTATNSYTGTFRGYPGMPSVGTGIMGPALRGGVDRMHFYHQPFDSLLGVVFTPTNFVWTDTFVFQPTNANVVNVSDANGRTIGTINNNRQGIQWLSPNPNVTGAKFWQQPTTDLKFLTQKVGRNVAAPDIIFVVDDLGLSADGVPIGWLRPTNSYINLSALNEGFVALPGTTNAMGPGIFTMGGATNFAPLIYQFTRLSEDFEVLWSGEASVVGNMQGMPSLWGWIKGPGPNDVIAFPQDNNEWRVENSVVPDVSPPTITLVSDDGGRNPIEAQTLTRTEETLTLIGNELASVTAIEIMSGNLVLQTIMPAQQYVVSNQRIDIPAGVLDDAGEGVERTVRVWNSVGASQVGPQKFKIETGRPIVTMTEFDNAVFDRAQALTLRGYGFKSKTTGETQLAHMRIDDSAGSAVDDNGTGAGAASNGRPRAVTFEILSDNLAVMPINAVKASADGSNRRLRVSRKLGTDAQDDGQFLSPASNNLFVAITTKPIISTLTQLESNGITWTAVTTDGAFRRDRILEFTGSGLNTATVIEVVQENGTSFANPVFIQLPVAGINVDDNGTRIQMSANSIPYTDADTNGTAKRTFKVYNAVGNTDLNASLMFAVNKQPVVDGISGFAAAGYFNRDKTLGDDITIFGSSLKSVGQVVFTDDNDSAQSRVTINLPAPGITVADNQIVIDTSTYQISSSADTDINSSRRIFQVVSARDNATSPNAQRFYVGAPPTMGTLSGLTSGSLHYRRDSDTLAITGGTGYGHISRVDIVDLNGNTIPGVPALTSGAGGIGGTGLNINNSTALTLNPNAIGFGSVGHLLDAVGATDRRVRITTPYGVITSAASATEAFTVSATPALKTTVQATFAGGGYDGGSNTYTHTAAATSALVINGENFRGVTKISFQDDTGAIYFNIALSPSNPPNGIAFNAAGTQITVQSSVFTAQGAVGTAWADSGGAALRRVQLTSAASQTANSQNIITSGGASATLPLFTSMAGPATGHFRRDQAGDLVITGANLGTATSVELVDAAGNAIAGHTALAPGANGQVTVAATTITINNNATWYTAAGDANETDTITALGRRIKITTPSGTVTTPADITGAFTISAEPLLAVTGTVFAGGGFAAGNATYNPGVGALLINDTGVDPLANGTTDGNAVPLKGIKQIELISDSVVATTLTSGWTVNAAGNQITIPAATAQLNGWSDAGGLFNRTVRLTTAADQTATTPAIRTEP